MFARGRSGLTNSLDEIQDLAALRDKGEGASSSARVLDSPKPTEMHGRVQGKRACSEITHFGAFPRITHA